MPQILLDWLIKEFPAAKRQTLKRMVQARRVRINGRPAGTLKDVFGDTDKIVVDDRPVVKPAAPPPQVRIVHEDEDILVLDKPVGLLTSTVPRELRPTLWAMAKEYVGAREPKARVGLIHRLDRDASGILIFSKNASAYQSLKDQFYDHTVRREYTALVHGVPKPPEGKIESSLLERADGTVHSTKQIAKGQIAITHYEVVRSVGKMSQLRVILQTGRKHQIRVQLSERGWPIFGDTVYGREDDDSKRLMLAATKLTIHHPREGEEQTFEISVEGEFAGIIEKAGTLQGKPKTPIVKTKVAAPMTKTAIPMIKATPPIIKTTTPMAKATTPMDKAATPLKKSES